MTAVPLVREKTTRADGSIIEMVIWKVPEDAPHPQGVRYRLAYVPRGADRPAVLYDNHHPKGDHKHIGTRESHYRFSTVGKLTADFMRDVWLWETGGTP